jgi:hypothetical protein
MKNIHLLSTDKPSKILFDMEENYYLPIQEEDVRMDYQDLVQNRHIYITSDELIKDVRPYKGKWQLEQGEILNKFPTYLTDLSECKLVIMTTDPDLIEDGVQPIDDEFLGWFIKNPTCEFVELGLEHYFDKNIDKSPFFPLRYKIIIPQEEIKQECCQEVDGFYLGTTCPNCKKPFRSVLQKEPNQETLEEYDIKDNQIMLLKEDLECVHMYLDDLELPRIDNKGEAYSIVGRIKRLEERMYSYDELRQIAYNAYLDNNPIEGVFNLWIQQFKKK